MARKNNLIKFIPHKCESCTQTTNKKYSLSKGQVHTLLAIHKKGQEKIAKGELPIVNTRKELNLGNSALGTLNILKFHGLIEMVARGNYTTTEKGQEFMRGNVTVPRTVITTKGSHGKIERIWEPDGDVRVTDLLKADEPYWDEEYARSSFIIKTEEDRDNAIFQDRKTIIEYN